MEQFKTLETTINKQGSVFFNHLICEKHPKHININFDKLKTATTLSSLPDYIISNYNDVSKGKMLFAVSKEGNKYVFGIVNNTKSK